VDSEVRQEIGNVAIIQAAEYVECHSSFIPSYWSPGFVLLDTREGGDVANEIPGSEDIAAAKALANEVQGRFAVKACWGTLDEWTYLEISPQK
jgi:hypothetical protein